MCQIFGKNNRNVKKGRNGKFEVSIQAVYGTLSDPRTLSDPELNYICKNFLSDPKIFQNCSLSDPGTKWPISLLKERTRKMGGRFYKVFISQFSF